MIRITIKIGDPHKEQLRIMMEKFDVSENDAARITFELGQMIAHESVVGKDVENIVWELRSSMGYGNCEGEGR